MVGDGHNIPYETCLGVYGDVDLDIDLKTTTDMKLEAIQFLKEYFGAERLAAATVLKNYRSSLAEAYVEVYSDLTGDEIEMTDREWVSQMISYVKKDERIHPGGMMLLPEGMEWEEVSPIRPNDDVLMCATHYDCYNISKIIPKLDVLISANYDLLQALFVATGTKPEDIDYQDPKVYEVFSNHDARSIPDFPYEFIQGPLCEFDAVSFSDLIKGIGMAHGSNVWNDNGEYLIKEHPLKELISDRDDVFLTLQKYGIDRETAYRIMVETRKGKLPWKGKYKWKSPDIKEMMDVLEQSDVPGWYVESMKKIHYLFPRANVVLYAKMAVAFAWFKVYYPEEYNKYISVK
jgi:DNA polymerase-3 subunit alpha (Gram-positive type)